MAFPTTFATVVTNPGGTGSTLTVSLPAHAAGDVIEILLAKTGNVAWNAPAGWTIKQQLTTSGSAAASTTETLLYRLVLPEDSLPLANPICVLGATVTRSAVAVTKRGADINGVHTASPWLAFGGATGNSNPIRPPAITTVTPDGTVYHYYCQRAATNAPEPTSYAQTQEVVISGTLVLNVAERNVAELSTLLSNQDVSPTSGARWAAMIVATPSVVPPVVVTPVTANLTLTTTTPTLVSVFTGALTDNFDDNSRDAGKWALGSIAFENAGVGVDEANQRVEITPLANEVSPAIYGYRSTNTYDFTNQQARVRVATSIASDVEAWLVVVLDANNYFRIWVAGGVLSTRSRVASNNSNESHGTYDFATQNHWRIRHDVTPDEIVFEVGNGVNWIELRRIARPVTITAMSVYLSGGTGASVASPALVTFDDFTLNTLTLLIPATATLTTATFATALVTKLTPAPASLSFATFAPTVSAAEEIAVTPGAATLTTTSFAPSLRIQVTPATATLTLVSFGPSLQVSATPTTANLTTTTFAPAIIQREVVTPATASLTTATFAPTLTRQEIVTPTTALLSTVGFASALRETITPTTQSLTLTTFAPVITAANNVTVIPSAASLALTSYAPSLHLTTTPATATLALTGFAPRLAQSITPTTASITLATFAPTLTTRRLITPEPATLTLASQTPNLRTATIPSTATLSLTGIAPVVIAGGNISIVPMTGVLTVAGNAPVLELGLTPATQALILQSFAPALTESVTVIPASTALTFALTAPVLQYPVTPTTATLTLTTLEPIISTGGTVEVIDPATANLTLTTLTTVLREYRTPARRILMVNFEQRTVLVPRETRQYKVESGDREEVLV